MSLPSLLLPHALPVCITLAIFGARAGEISYICLRATSALCRVSRSQGQSSFVMASLLPLPPIVASRPTLAEYSSAAELVVAHNCDYPKESPRIWRPNCELPPWQPDA